MVVSASDTPPGLPSQILTPSQKDQTSCQAPSQLDICHLSSPHTPGPIVPLWNHPRNPTIGSTWASFWARPLGGHCQAGKPSDHLSLLDPAPSALGLILALPGAKQQPLAVDSSMLCMSCQGRVNMGTAYEFTVLTVFQALTRFITWLICYMDTHNNLTRQVYLLPPFYR